MLSAGHQNCLDKSLVLDCVKKKKHALEYFLLHYEEECKHLSILKSNLENALQARHSIS